MRVSRHAWAAALVVGPCAAYLAWALQRGRRAHIGLALLANVVLWVGGPTLIGVMLSWQP